MHVLIPFASTLSETSRQTFRQLNLPHLSQLLTRLTPGKPIGGDEQRLSMPHELALARIYGWSVDDDGCLPWAARLAAQDGIPVRNEAWGLLSPVHFHIGTDHVTLADPQALRLSAQESHTLFEVVKPLFESEGWTMAWGGPTRWYCAHDSLDGLATASLDRVIGRNIQLWMPTAEQSRLVRRLQNEVQMLLYQQPLNDHRVGLGALPVNSFWLSGCGRPQRATEPADLQIELSLREHALARDWPAWAQAWKALDAGPLRELLERSKRHEPVGLTLGGDRVAQTFSPEARGLWARLSGGLRATSPAPLLEVL
jgi:hypothetical protein